MDEEWSVTRQKTDGARERKREEEAMDKQGQRESSCCSSGAGDEARTLSRFW